MSPSPSSRLRLGIVVPKYGHGAVDRNRLKRRLRELSRTVLLPLPLSLDVVIWAQRSAYQASFDALQAQLQSLGARLPALAPSA